MLNLEEKRALDSSQPDLFIFLISYFLSVLVVFFFISKSGI
jgi:hypothetical protein